MEIEGFHLINLITNNIPFTLIDMRPQSLRDRDEPMVTAMLKGGLNMNFKSAFKHIEGAAADKSQPIIILDRWDWRAKSAAKKFSKLNYLNVYFLQGGIKNFVTALKDQEKL